MSECVYDIISSMILWNPGNLLSAPTDGFRLGKIYPGQDIEGRGLYALDEYFFDILAKIIIGINGLS